MFVFLSRLRCLVKQLERGEASLVDLKKNLEYAATVLESVYVEETRYTRGATHTDQDFNQSQAQRYRPSPLQLPASLKMQFCLLQRDVAAQR